MAHSELTPREREVADLVGEALTRRKIASRLGISVSTVDSHLQSIASKVPYKGSALRAVFQWKLEQLRGSEEPRDPEPVPREPLRQVYFIRGGEFVKIGIAQDAEERLNAIQTTSPFPLSLLGWVPGRLADEARIHEELSDYRAHGEWFRATPEVLETIEEALERDE